MKIKAEKDRSIIVWPTILLDLIVEKCKLILLGMIQHYMIQVVTTSWWRGGSC